MNNAKSSNCPDFHNVASGRRKKSCTTLWSRHEYQSLNFTA